MSFLGSNLLQTIVYWGNPVLDGYGGASFDAPVELSVRWEDRQQLFIDSAGQEAKSFAVVFISQDVDIGGWFFLGTIGEIDSDLTDIPQKVPNARQIRGFRKIPNINASLFERKVWL